MSTQLPGTTRYDAVVTRKIRHPDGTWRIDDILSIVDAPAWELAPALKLLTKKIHESPPPVVLEGQGELV
jgi:hypothetical protein